MKYSSLSASQYRKERKDKPQHLPLQRVCCYSSHGGRPYQLITEALEREPRTFIHVKRAKRFDHVGGFD